MYATFPPAVFNFWTAFIYMYAVFHKFFQTRQVEKLAVLPRINSIKAN